MKLALAVRAAALLMPTLRVHAWLLQEECPLSLGSSSMQAEVSLAASLLQRQYRSEGRGTVREDTEDEVQAPPCKGERQDSRCWVLSELGKNCHETCLKHGRAFKFAIPESPLVPKLLNSKPAHKNGPWMAFECYKPADDGYNLVSHCSANDFRDNQGTWSDPSCRLSCPCGGVKECDWKPPSACEPIFIYKGATFTGCTSVDSDKPWCQHDHDNQSGWSHCVHECVDASADNPMVGSGESDANDEVDVAVAKPAATPAGALLPPSPSTALNDEACFWDLASDCLPEFDYGGVHLAGCTRVNHHTPWCSKSDPFESSSWSHCIFTCPAVTPDIHVEMQEQNSKAQDDDTVCGWTLAPECVSHMQFSDVEVDGCTDLGVEGDYQWCSLDSAYKGRWSLCTRNCGKASLMHANTSQHPVH